MVNESIIVPNKLTGVRFVRESTEQKSVENKLNEVFHKTSNGWYVKDETEFRGTRNPFYQGHLDPINGQLIIGLDDIAKEGDSPGGLYVLTEKNIRWRLAENVVAIGEVDHPDGGSRIMTHRIRKKDLMKAGDKVIHMRYSGGDGFLHYQLLHEMEGDLLVVKGMDFGSYSLPGKPIKILEVEYTQKRTS